MHVLPPASAFSQAVFKLIRPAIPRERWPAEPVRATFKPGMDGYFLVGEYDGLGQGYDLLAARLTVEAGVDLVVLSPSAPAAAAVVKVKRWRDAFLYLAAPMLFAIPILGMLAQPLMKVAAVAFGLDAAALLAAQMALSSARGALAQTRFVADIPTPGYRLQVAAAGAVGTAPPDPMPGGV